MVLVSSQKLRNHVAILNVFRSVLGPNKLHYWDLSLQKLPAIQGGFCSRVYQSGDRKQGPRPASGSGCESSPVSTNGAGLLPLGSAPPFPELKSLFRDSRKWGTIYTESLIINHTVQHFVQNVKMCVWCSACSWCFCLHICKRETSPTCGCLLCFPELPICIDNLLKYFL